MNAAARLVHQNVLSRHLLLTSWLSRQHGMILVLLFAVLFSALSTIYVTYTARIFQATYQRHLVEYNRLHTLNNQLLLEKAAWMVSSRIQQVAEKELEMKIPTHDSIIVIHE